MRAVDCVLDEAHSSFEGFSVTCIEMRGPAEPSDEFGLTFAGDITVA